MEPCGTMHTGGHFEKLPSHNLLQLIQTLISPFASFPSFEEAFFALPCKSLASLALTLEDQELLRDQKVT